MAPRNKSGQFSKAPEPTEGERVLDEAYTAVREFLSVTDAQATAIVLYAAATHAIRTFPAFGRMLFAANGPESGKTVAMMVTASLSSAAENAAGSSYAVTSMLAQATNQPEQPVPTLYRDEISEVFGKSGLNSSKDPIAAVLRDGYKRGATTMWSVNRVAEKISVYVPVLMAGNGTAVPQDIRSRSIVVKMTRGRPTLDFDSDGSEARLDAIGKALAHHVRKASHEMKGYTCEGLIPGLTGRKHQVWRPLIGVARFVGGARWLNKSLDAFNELTNTGGSNEVLSADQAILKDLARIVGDMEPSAFVGGLALSEELACLDRFEGRTANSLTKDVIRAMSPVEPSRHRMPGVDNPVRGYYVKQVLAQWEAMRPARVDEIAAMETETNAFA